MNFSDLFIESMPRLLTGMGVTIQLTIISLFFATFLGLFSCLLSISKNKVFNFISAFYIDIIRGITVIVLSFFIYFGVTKAFDFRMSAMTAAVLTLSLNAGAYMSEIFRGGIFAVSSGQMEAARSLGLPYGKAMLKIILPQAVRIVIPSLVNQFIITLKDTSIMSAIGLRELTMTGDKIIAVNFESFKIWAMVAMLYLIVITFLSRVSRYIERRITNVKGNR